MTPDTMIELVSNGDIKSLLIYLSGELPQNRERLFSEVMDYKIYWLNRCTYCLIKGYYNCFFVLFV